MFPKGPPTHGHPCPNMVHQKILQCQCSSEGQVVACPGRLWMVTTDLPLVNMYLQMEMHLQPGPDLADGSISSSSIGHHHTPPWHRRHLTNHCHPWHFDRSSVWLCYLQQSNAWQQRSCPCSGRIWASHCSSPRLFPTQIPAWTTSNYYSFIWLFYLTVLHYSWNGTTFCLKTMLSFILHPRDWCVILQSLWIKVILADLQLINMDISIDM